MTMGAPIKEVMAFMGSTLFMPGNPETMSQNRQTTLPIKNDAGINILWSNVLKNILEK